MCRWLLDTNIIISGLFWSGNESKLLELAIAEKYEAVISEFVLREAERIIKEKFSEMEEKVQPVLSLLMKSAENYPLLAENKVVEFKNQHGEIISDKGDLVILATALEAGVDAIITGDKHFDNSEVKELIEVIDAGDALARL